MPARRVTFVLPFDDSDESDIDFEDHDSDFEDGLDSGEDEELDLKEDIILLEDNNSLFNSNSKPKKGTFFINIK